LRAPFLRERLENLGRFVADHSFAFGYWADQAAEDGQSAKFEIGATVVDANLRVALEEGFGRVKIADANLAVGAARHHAKSAFVHHFGPSWGAHPLACSFVRDKPAIGIVRGRGKTKVGRAP
jgi:hypothetical protein